MRSNKIAVLKSANVIPNNLPVITAAGWILLDEKEYEISDLTFTWLAEQKGIEVHLIGNLKQHKKISYETAIVVPLLNREEP